MGRRIPRGAGWRLVAALTLLIALAGMFPQGTRAASGIAIAVTDEAGTPLAGAAFGVFDASVDLDGALFIDSGAPLLGGPVVTDDGGLAFVPDLPDDRAVGVSQLVIPAGYQADVAGDRFLTTDATLPGSLNVVNAALPGGMVVVSVTEQVTATALGGVTVEARAVDPATDSPGAVVSSAASDTAGAAELTLPVGDYVVSVVPPGGYLPAESQPVAVSVSADGVPLDTSVAFGLEPVAADPNDPVDQVDPTEPPAEPTATDVPTEPAPTATTPAEPTATDVPTEPAPTATTPAEPTATDVPTEPPASAAPTEAPTQPAASEGSGDGTDFVPNQPTTIQVRAIVCTSDDPALIGTFRITPNTDLVSGDAALPDVCRPARASEFTFVFRDPRLPDPWDDIALGQRPTDANGLASFPTVITRDGQEIFILEQSSPNDFQSDPVPLVPNGTVSMLAIKVIGPPQGDVVVRTVDSVTGAALAGSCYGLAAAGATDVRLASACDADDGADGSLTFPALANGDYVVMPTTTPPGYVAPPVIPLTVSSQPVDLPVAAVPFGTLQLLARSCVTPPAGVVIPTPTPASGDGIDGTDGMDGSPADDLPADGTGEPMVVFSVVDGSAIGAAGSGLEGDAADTDCTAIGASLLVTAPDGTTTTITVGADGVASPAPLPPTTGDARYTVRDTTTGAEVAVAINPAGTTTVTLVALADGLGDQTGDPAAAAMGQAVPAVLAAATPVG